MIVWCAEKAGTNGKRGLVPSMGVGYRKKDVEFQIGQSHSYEDPAAGFDRAKDQGWSAVKARLEYP